MQILAANELTKAFGINTILERISFTVSDGDKIGLIGLNGSGKTTLFNVITGESDYDSGNISKRRDLKIGYLKQHIGLDSNLSIFDDCLQVFTYLIEMEEKLRLMEAEISSLGEAGDSEALRKLMDEYAKLSELFLEKNGYGYRSEIRGTLKGLGFSESEIDRPINILSGGQKSRLSLAKLLLEKPELLFLDEPTNHLDIQAIDWLEKYLKEFKGSFVVISHDRYFLDQVVNRIFLLENHSLHIYNTNYTDFMKRRKIDKELERKHYENQQKEIERQEEIIKRFIAYGGKHITLAQSRQKLLNKIKLVDVPTNDSKRSKIVFEPKLKSGKDVLRVENISKYFDDFKLLSDINFSIYRGEKVGLIGPNGIGKTTLFKIILGALSYDDGEIILGHHVSPGYFDQEMKNLNLDKTIVDEIWDENPSFDYLKIRNSLAKFMFYGDDIFKEISSLSGGERGRLSLLKLMLSNTNFLLMDEPTNHLDIDSKEVLEEALRSYEGTVFVISHDRYFLNNVATKILDLTLAGVTEYQGNYDYYLEKKGSLNLEEDEEEDINKTQLKQNRKRVKAMQKEQRSIQLEKEKLEKQISELENLLVHIDIELCKPEIYEDKDVILELNNERDQTEIKLSELYEAWVKYE